MTRSTSKIRVTSVEGQSATFQHLSGPHVFGNSFGVRDGITLTPGDYVVETLNVSRLVGLRPASSPTWLWRDSDEDLAEQHRAFVADVERRRRASLEANRVDWTRRTAALPPWGRDRIARFGEQGGERFALEGWGYELVICELAVLYQASGGQNTDEIDAYDQANGCSGNQHDYARALARTVTEGRPGNAVLAPAGLSPLTGSADYS